MFDRLQAQLLGQELVYEQYRSGAAEDGLVQAQQDAAGAITEINTVTLTLSRSGQIVALDLPQALAAGSSPTFVTVTFTNAALTRTNLGLGALAVLNAAAASADTAPAQTAAYVQVDVQAILTELRDLKTKLRAAGILAP